MKLFIRGNVLLLLCCIFYLTWWLIAFKPEGAIKGIQSGWLLIPAAICGLSAVVEIVMGVRAIDLQQAAISNVAICVAGVVAYALLLIVTAALMKRQVTTELILIVGWVTMMAAELNALYAAEVFGLTQAVGLFAAAVVLALISLVCYLAYYQLDAVKGYFDGAVPLVSVGVMTAVMLILLVSKQQAP